MMRARSIEAGFTLVELLVSIAILSLCATMLLGGLASASIVARQTRGQQQEVAEVAAAQMLLRSRLEAMVPVPRLDTSDPRIDTDGNERIFDFLAPPPDSEAGTGLRRYRLLLTAPGDLILYNSAELASDVDRNAPSMQGWQRTTLLRGASALSISYFGRTRTDPQGKWRVGWYDSSAMPAAIRVRVGFPQGDRRSWPELLVRPASTLDLACNPENKTRCGGAA